MKLKSAGTLAQDLVRSLYGLDDKKLTEKFKNIILPLIETDAKKIIHGSGFISLLKSGVCTRICPEGDEQCIEECNQLQYISPEEAMQIAINYLSNGALPATLKHIDPEQFAATFGRRLNYLSNYVDLYKLVQKLKNQEKLDVASLNLFIDYLHMTSGVYFKYLRQFGMKLNLTRYHMLHLFSVEKMSNLLDGIETVIRNDPEVENLLPEITELKSTWAQLKPKLENVINLYLQYMELDNSYRASLDFGEIFTLWNPEHAKNICSQLVNPIKKKPLNSLKSLMTY